jgi:hypothetical protein
MIKLSLFLGGDKKSDSKKGGEKKESKKGGSKGGNKDAVITLTDSNFDDEVLNSDDVWMVRMNFFSFVTKVLTFCFIFTG